jgi:hypothetical protein|tara:strand:+ start:494 stop:946 length:453 start_codon:yes stop_codon:yes gene_type:complete
MSNLEYLDLPKIPDYLLVDIYQTIRNTSAADRHSNKEGTDAEKSAAWNSIKASDKLKQFVATLFEDEHDVHIFVLSADLPMHKDNTRDAAYNYVLETGNALTNFHNDDGNVIESHSITTFQWHKLDVSTYHSVSIPNGPRVVVSVSIHWD